MENKREPTQGDHLEEFHRRKYDPIISVLIDNLNEASKVLGSISSNLNSLDKKIENHIFDEGSDIKTFKDEFRSFKYTAESSIKEIQKQLLEMHPIWSEVKKFNDTVILLTDKLPRYIKIFYKFIGILFVGYFVAHYWFQTHFHKFLTFIKSIP